MFPPLDTANEDGLLAIGGNLEVELLLEAYSNGIFPWPHQSIEPLLWFSPDPRCILEFDDLKINQRLKRYLKNIDWEFRINENFSEVIYQCSLVSHRKNQDDTWIRKDVLEGYTRFHQAGFAMSFEVYENQKLIGGMYGVKIKNFFAGESMFSLKSNASKFVLIQTVEVLKNQGLTWMDVQVSSPLLDNFGAKMIGRNEYLKKLDRSLS